MGFVDGASSIHSGEHGMQRRRRRHRVDWLQRAVCSLLPFGTMGRICRKSPPRTTVMPPKGFWREAGGRKVQEPTLCMLNVFGEFLPDGFPQTLWWMHRSILRQAPVKAVDDAGLKVSQAEGCLYNGVWSSGV
ncbi:uncharacterized protein [Oryza sativa Japonica Group]|uniref:uncharacterized protein n=1 Tax=Oryza sativa subsp. japonica TaxID=39947 RepID=UPI00077541A1|nr:uncharacterized protein LOC107279026 [Oryza sativa Japonica Group]